MHPLRQDRFTCGAPVTHKGHSECLNTMLSSDEARSTCDVSALPHVKHWAYLVMGLNAVAVVSSLQPCFDLLYDCVKKLFAVESLLMQMEKCALMEALVLIGNQFKDFSKQKAFLEELMGPVVSRWTSDETSR